MKEKASGAASTDYVCYNEERVINKTIWRLTLLTFADWIRLRLLALRTQANEFLQYALSFLKATFLALQRDWIKAHHLWRAHCSQPVAVENYRKLVPAEDDPREGFHIFSVAQIYPDGRKIKTSIRHGRKPEACLAIRNNRL